MASFSSLARALRLPLYSFVGTAVALDQYRALRSSSYSSSTHRLELLFLSGFAGVAWPFLVPYYLDAAFPPPSKRS